MARKKKRRDEDSFRSDPDDEEDKITIRGDVDYRYLLNQQLKACMRLMSIATAYRTVEIAQASWDSLRILGYALLPWHSENFKIILKEIEKSKTARQVFNERYAELPVMKVSEFKRNEKLGYLHRQILIRKSNVLYPAITELMAVRGLLMEHEIEKPGEII